MANYFFLESYLSFYLLQFRNEVYLGFFYQVLNYQMLRLFPSSIILMEDITSSKLANKLSICFQMELLFFFWIFSFFSIYFLD